ncbi:hypothetical protein C5745_17110 [Sphingobacterium haloxyli]|uniref:Alpha/beta hydrolase n=2 Tax=Sphingobacterium haloxyli TaxID=2100533 RepID=A0A2S9J070_9SPHI|nr:hypothetical protein C5745_17110 [Sphingobacterium haloxyli]
MFSLVGQKASAQLSAQKHIVYLHGKIIEDQGREAISEAFGKYELDSILAAFKAINAVVYCEIRNTNADPKRYAKRVSKQIDSLIAIGVRPKNITIVGASKGAIIASHISSFNTHLINYVFLAGNNAYQEQNNNWKFHGQVLSIFDASDDIAGKSYQYWKDKDNYTTTFEEIELNTGLGHGFLYKPLTEWMEPTKKWIAKQKL